MSPMLNRLLKALLPPLVLGIALTGAYVMWINRPPVETQTPIVAPPSVRVQRVAFESVDLTVTSQGTVQPRTASQLVPEIAGTVINVSPAFAVGGFFEEGDVLLEIDTYDYRQALIAGQSQLAQARLRLAQEEAEAEVARREWEELGGGNANALTLREPQVEDARAAVASAEAAIDRARRDLERAQVRAPYAGRVQSKDVDVGQFVNRGTAVGRIYAVDSAEVRLPLPDEELAYVDVPMSYRGTQQQAGPDVVLSADFAGRRFMWQGRIARTEGEIDAVSRMVHVVAEVDDPYAPGSDPSRPPLAVGMFVEAEIAGRRVDDVVVLPWAALNGRDQVLIVDDDGRLRFRQIEILRSTTESVLVRSGLSEGELVSISALDAVIDGMAVQIAEGAPAMARADVDASPGRGPGNAAADSAAAPRAEERATPVAATPRDGGRRSRGRSPAAEPQRAAARETPPARRPAVTAPRETAPTGGPTPASTSQPRRVPSSSTRGCRVKSRSRPSRVRLPPCKRRGGAGRRPAAIAAARPGPSGRARGSGWPAPNREASLGATRCGNAAAGNAIGAGTRAGAAGRRPGGQGRPDATSVRLTPCDGRRSSGGGGRPLRSRRPEGPRAGVDALTSAPAAGPPARTRAGGRQPPHRRRAGREARPGGRLARGRAGGGPPPLPQRVAQPRRRRHRRGDAGRAPYRARESRRHAGRAAGARRRVERDPAGDGQRGHLAGRGRLSARR